MNHRPIQFPLDFSPPRILRKDGCTSYASSTKFKYFGRCDGGGGVFLAAAVFCFDCAPRCCLSCHFSIDFLNMISCIISGNLLNCFLPQVEAHQTKLDPLAPVKALLIVDNAKVHATRLPDVLPKPEGRCCSSAD